MKLTRRKFVLITAFVIALGAVFGGAAIAAGGEDATETPISAGALASASAAALKHTGGGAVTATEVEDEESYYEVEVTFDDGRQVDVQLNRAFKVVGSEGEASAGD